MPGDKSISHRTVILGALSIGETRAHGLLESEDVLGTIRAARLFGAEVERTGAGQWSVYGLGTGGFAEPADIIDCGNSGTGVRLLMGAMATTSIHAVFTGDSSLRSRPMNRVIEPLAQFGAECRARNREFLPISILGSENPIPVSFKMTAPSAQVKSAILLAGLNAPGRTEVIERTATRDHTERMLKAFGADITVEGTDRGTVISLGGHLDLSPQSVSIPRDPSSAAFPIAAAAICEGSEVLIRGILVNPTRAGFFQTLIEMGADLVFENRREESGEPVADVRVRHSGLSGVEVPPDRAPSMIDEFPILSVIAAFAEGRTTMRGVRELRIKESDRIDAMARGLKKCGVQIAQSDDSLTVHGRGPGGVRGGAECNTFLDHRIAMSFLCLGLAARSPVSVDDASPIATSFPDFQGIMSDLGAKLTAGEGIESRRQN